MSRRQKLQPVGPAKRSGIGKLFGFLGGKDALAEEREAAFQLVTTTKPLPPGAVLLEDSPRLLAHGIKAQIAILPEEGKGLYYVQEPELTQIDRRAYVRLMYRLTFTARLQPGLGSDAYTGKKLEQFIIDKAREVSEEFGSGGVHEMVREKLIYYVKRDLLGYGPLDPLMHDSDLEDILVTGYDRPFVVIDRRWADLDWLETNVLISHDQLDQLARRLALMGRSSLSVAFPTVMTMLPTHDRLAATYRYEVSPGGTSMSIRRFREEPLTIPQLVDQNQLSPLMAAYLWAIVEEKGVIFVIGLPGSGKTVFCNALSLLLRPQFHPVTIEDFPELNLPQAQRHSLTARYVKAVRGEGGKKGEQAGEVAQVDLLRLSLRIRPDFLIVGEILTEEAPVMFQAINTGLGGSTSFHAGDVHSAVTRLIEKTIGVDPAMLRMIDAVVSVQRLKHPRTGKVVRRCTSVDEIRDVGNYNKIFSWVPTTDVHAPGDVMTVVKNSIAMQKLVTRRGITEATLASELEEKIAFLKDISVRGQVSFEAFSNAVKSFYAERAKDMAVKRAPEITETAGKKERSPEERLMDLLGESGG